MFKRTTLKTIHRSEKLVSEWREVHYSERPPHPKPWRALARLTIFGAIEIVAGLVWIITRRDFALRIFNFTIVKIMEGYYPNYNPSQ